MEQLLLICISIGAAIGTSIGTSIANNKNSLKSIHFIPTLIMFLLMYILFNIVNYFMPLFPQFTIKTTTTGATIATGATATTVAANTYDNIVKIYSGDMPVIRFSREQDLKASNYSIFKRKAETGDLDGNAPPFDNLEPKELLKRLNYIYYATANPYQPISYANFTTEADKRVAQDGSSLSSKDPFYAEYNAKYYPQLSKNLLDTKDCLNGGNGPDSCFVTPQLFANIAAHSNSNSNSATTKPGIEAFTCKSKSDTATVPTSILTQGLNNFNKLFLTEDRIVKEGFESNPMILNPATRHLPVMYRNAPDGQDKPLDLISNEYITIDESDKLCRTCKLAVCKDDYCGLQNQLFI